MLGSVPARNQLQAAQLGVFLQGAEQRDQQLGVGVVFGSEVAGVLNFMRQCWVMQQCAQGGEGGRFDADRLARCARLIVAAALFPVFVFVAALAVAFFPGFL